MNRIATIASVERLRNSADGNPRYRVHFEGGGTAETKADSAVNYVIANSDMHGVPVRFIYDGDRIAVVEPVTKHQGTGTAGVYEPR